jgi:large conductance mechanosensitive channel
MLKEFKEFAMKGNLIDMAVGFVMGGAFATVVTAFIQGVFLPVLAPIMGGIDLSSLKIEITPAVLDAAGEVTKPAAIMEIGLFISALISFLIVAFVMFMLIKGMNKLKKEPEFYNTITNTCTTNIVHHVNLISKDRIPLLRWEIVFPKESDRLAYNLGLIDTDLSFEEARTRYHINDRALRYADDPNFSAKIRGGE